MSLFFNADYEQQLFSTSAVRTQSNATNQELEYFLFLLENEEVFTTKSYDNNYISHIEQLGGEVKTTIDPTHLTCWWGDYQQIEHKRFLNSKLTSTSLAINNKQCHAETRIINSLGKIKNNFLYKSPQGMSGKGIYKAHQKDKILKLLKNTPLIEEPLLDRNLDVSYLHLGESGIIYQNQVDQHFQYRGTTIGASQISSLLEKQFLNTIEIVKAFMNSHQAHGPWSLDAFTYFEGNLEKLYGISEINYRKTMGYIAYMLHQKWYVDGFSELMLIPRNKINKFQYFCDDEIKILSPVQNRFTCFFLHGKTISQIIESKEKIMMDFDVNP